MKNPEQTSSPVAFVEAEAETRRAADSSERAYNAIRKLLIEFQLKPEERINEMRLAKSLAISRTPIREALNRLASEGFVSLTPNRGFFVRSLSTEGLIDLYELRSIIECAAFRLMCERASDEHIGRLQSYWGKIVDGYIDQPADDILAEDEGFHLLIAELSGNPELVNQLQAINARIRFIRRIQIEHRSHDNSLISTHSAIVEAAVARAADEGVELLRQHIELTVSATQQALKDALLRVYSQPKPLQPLRFGRSTSSNG
ncbi:GntR family transcriptional regulator [Rhizobium metallidurans]|uniref:DNA-binding GntR family transcriptional regulator n=1 Tax=Rhizobium metallidurans TaxID=1265931 RepID=A0A7W6GEK8_9HYPH|nr:GntR family transcriptional regulator [Rhizobium metallidurans]MBB3966791.1 DNA-binding GntR family transcriptional regulator [Rhizobium metallidurans]